MINKVVLGDHTNDLKMLLAADESIVVSNAIPELKDIVDQIHY